MTRHVVIAGASGFLGRHLSKSLIDRGHAVTALTRKQSSAPDESTWDPYEGKVDQGLIEEADVVVNVAGSPTAGNPHSEKWARELRESRVVTTQVLADAIAATDSKPVFLAGNAIAFYGDHGSEVLTEDADSRGDSLMTQVCREWQAAAEPAVDAGARVAILRTAPVMDRTSPPLKQLRLLFKTGLGGRLGDGRQYFPVISLRDWVAAVTWLAENDDLSGPVNLCCPTTPTNAEFTRALARAVNRPALTFVPAPVLKVAAGRMAPEVLGSQNLRPAALEAAGFSFRDRDVTSVLASALAKEPKARK
ncbi:TIGR01777 family oxidoreductase [Nocardioides sp. GCM10027113]|uniref:TIGR01777 family oxidoreductase n=1 Tax=unclassified Nocardioides TaxID=2615069 RepID=UPI00361888CE